jgi:(2R)-sulfolactate sulfo-lyase subunit alpha
MDTQEPVEVTVSQDIPLGHKIAMQDHETDGAVIKYGADIGRVSEPIKKGQHVHIHNLKTRRW